MEVLKLTSVSLLTNHILDGALVGGGHSLFRNRTAPVIEALGFVHSTLERIALPAEHIIGVSAVSTSALEAPYKRVGSA